uniref:SOS1 n=1 Tax=Rhizophora mucronata TaxID=61149 RepID=A0A2P2LR87_RHIMU
MSSYIHISPTQECQVIYSQSEKEINRDSRNNTHHSSMIPPQLLYSIFCLHQALSIKQQLPQDQ